jgi:hypothetical protein
MDIRIGSRAFSNGFDITTPAETFTAKESPLEGILLYNPVGTQIARVAARSFFGSEWNIVISGGGGYQFCRESFFATNLICKGEGRTIGIHIENVHWFGNAHRFEISEGVQTIAECSRAAFSNDYDVSLVEESDFKLVVCIVLALTMSEQSSSPVPM